MIHWKVSILFCQCSMQFKQKLTCSEKSRETGRFQIIMITIIIRNAWKKFTRHQMRIFYSDCRSYIDRDCYVGLTRTASSCTCQDVAEDECEACRASWSWSDGTAMSWWNWHDGEPGEFSCGRISPSAWAENECSTEIRYICERGTFRYVEVIRC